MVSEWKDAKLGDYIDSCLGKMLDKNKNTGEFHPYLGNSNVRWGAFELDELSEMKFESHEHERYGIKKGDLIVCEGGEPGRCAIWNEDVPDMKIQKALHRVRTLAGLDGDYLYYWFLFSARAGHIDPYFTGTTIKHLTGKALKELPIKIPPMRYQQEAAKLLRGFDNKITLNRQINQTLEQMAQTLFKSWFVDFDPVMDNALDAGNPIPDELQHRAEARNTVRESEGFKPLPDDVRQLFPDAFEESELGWVPKGWGVQRLDVTLDLAYGKALKKTDRIDGDVPVYGSGGVNGTHNVSIVDGPGIIVGRKGTVGSLYWEPNNFYPIDTVFYVKPKSGYSMEYCYELLKTLGLEHMNTDAAVPGLNRNNAYRLVSAKPTPELIELFTQNASVYRSRISHCCSESNTLTKLRDTLLPKLISGELRLDEVELAVEQETVSAEQQNER
ncbi:restriction endonuclease subunit S [Vibrio cholerae]